MPASAFTVIEISGISLFVSASRANVCSAFRDFIPPYASILSTLLSISLNGSKCASTERLLFLRI
ncbi:MAG: hypothetical protein R3A12_15145 [Ignavibacteria bacterium]